MLKLLSKRCCEIAWFPLPCHFKSLETFVLNVLPNVLHLLSIPSLRRLINFFSVTTNKRNNSLSTQSEEKRERESCEERDNRTIDDQRNMQRRGVDRPSLPLPAYRGRRFSSGRGKYTQTAFFISRLLPAQSRMQVKATELAPRYEVAVLHSPRPREPVHPRHCSIFLPFRRSSAGQRPPPDTRDTTTL